MKFPVGLRVLVGFCRHFFFKIFIPRSCFPFTVGLLNSPPKEGGGGGSGSRCCAETIWFAFFSFPFLVWVSLSRRWIQYKHFWVVLLEWTGSLLWFMLINKRYFKWDPGRWNTQSVQCIIHVLQHYKRVHHILSDTAKGSYITSKY